MGVIVADGHFVLVTQSGYPDPSYAMRGAADSIGIVTTFQLQTRSAPPQVVSYYANFSSILESPDILADVVHMLQSFVTSSPFVDRDLTLEIYTSILGDFTVRGRYFGDREHFPKVVFQQCLRGRRLQPIPLLRSRRG